MTNDSGADNDLISISSNQYYAGKRNTIKAGAGNDLISLGSGNVNNTITGGIGNDTIILQNMNHVVQYASGDGNDIIEGFNRSDTLHITSGSISKAGYSGDDAIIYVGSNYITLKDAAERSLNFQIGSGAVFSTIMSDKIDVTPGGNDDTEDGGEENYIINSTASTLINGTSGADTINNTGKNTTINGNDGNDFIKDYATVDAIQIDTDEIAITGVETVNSNVIIETSEGNITLKSGKDKQLNLIDSNVTISGGAGNDTIENYGKENIYQYAQGDGNDTILGFNENDTLQITESAYSYSISGSDLIVKVGKGAIKLGDAADKTVNILDASGNLEVIDNEGSTPPNGWKYGTSSKTSTDPKILTASIASAESALDLNEDYGDGVEKVDASKIKDGVEIYGNDLNNSIKGGKGDDKLDGGSGNDTVSLGAGDDTYIYTGGDDLIYDYATIDAVQLDAGVSVTNMATISSNVIITTTEGNITLKGGKGKTLNLTDTNGDALTNQKNCGELLVH